MKKKVYNKLVRDRIPEVLTNKEIKFSTHVADEKEYLEKLHEKLVEEVAEFVEDPCIEEIIDIFEVLDVLRNVYDYKFEDLKLERKRKRISRGGFNDKIILEWTK